jgi:hypothetical protein
VRGGGFPASRRFSGFATVLRLRDGFAASRRFSGFATVFRLRDGFPASRRFCGFAAFSVSRRSRLAEAGGAPWPRFSGG